MLLFYLYFQWKKAQAFKSEKIHIPTDVQVQIFFQFHLPFTPASLEKNLYLGSATVSTHSPQ